MDEKFKYKLAENTIEKSEITKLSQWLLKNEKLTMGNKTVLFQKKFSNFLKVKNSIYVNSGSSANLLIAQSLLESGYLKNNLIIAPAVSWSTTVTPFIQLGYQVKLCDCSTLNLGLDIKHLEQLCKKYKPSIIILVHVLGHANDMQKIIKLCKKYKIYLIEDTCEALGSKYKSKNLGTFGLASSFSFYYGHHISTIEGGMACTKDKNLANIMKSVRSHGWVRDFEKFEKQKIIKKNNISEFQSKFSFFYSGFNIRSTDINAFLGLTQIKKIKKITKIRNRNFNIYKNELSDYFSVKCDTKPLSSFGYATLTKNRDSVFRHFLKKKIECRPIISGNIGEQPFWKKKNKKAKLPNADVIHQYGIYLPNHANQSTDDTKFICKEFKKVAKVKSI
jgi:CDP-6-deoxy-D-xylo-4-hexulose-3-dehydrase